MSLYGYHRKTTPNIDALARDAIVFENAIAQWPKTTPAFASIMTGKYGHTTGVTRITAGQRLGDEHETLAEVLRDHGYETGVFVSTPALGVATNVLQGFGTIEEVWRSPDPFARATNDAVAWLREHRVGPFFAWVHYNNAHYPYEAHGAQPDMFVEDAFYDARRRVRLNPPGGLPLEIPVDHPYRTQILRPDVGGVHTAAILPERPHEIDFYLARYDAGIYGADRMLGILLRAVREIGLLEDTIVVIIGDHGESLGEHDYFFEHGRFPYDETVRVPLVIRWPGRGTSSRVPTPVAAFGLAPTLLEMLGIEVPEAMESRSLLPVVHGKEEGRHVFTESGYQLDFTLSVRDSTWKLIHNPNEIDQSLMAGSEYELYNLDSDPGELHNVYLAEPEVTARLRAVLENWSGPWIAAAYATGSSGGLPLDPATRERLYSLGYLP